MPHKPKTNRIGEKQIQNCGWEAEIIGYRNASDMDVRFSDGIEVKHRRYDQFRKGKICHPNEKKYQYKKRMKKRIGEKRMQKCGLEAEIIDYRNNSDMDIQFPDGAKIKHKTYDEFNKGSIYHPNENRYKKHMRQRIGEKRVQKCGLEAEIIDYQSTKNITVMFLDKIIVNKKEYQRFQQKKIGHPTINRHFHRYIGTIFPKDRSKIYNTNIHGIAYIINDTYYYFCHCPICNMHEIWTFNDIKNHKCNHTLVKEREKIAQAYIATIRPTQ